ncbi:MAG: TonB-dependent receptor [Sphingomonas sp.]|uniref:TonB-dependent receptor n=1 Tax=Sphingomonas sp. TaxID=28214 RepID=UPI00261A08BD|nr:TonB-dependent receptor [Sphingomonas sp.]MDK2770010.1 TonB-dependent receptor [Sphingomonas sp.]
MIVTAQRRTENVQKTPIALTVVTGEDIEKRAQVNLADVLSTTPAVQVSGNAGGGQVYIRGVGSNNDVVYGNPAVNLNIDGIYQQQTSTVLSAMYDIERVEVLRGPQGTLYGRNATGGSINVITKDPSTDRFEAGASVLLGNYEHIRVQGMFNAPLSDSWAIRGAISFNDRDGYSNAGSDARYVSMRLKSLFEVSPDVRIMLAARYLDEWGAPAASVEAPLSARDDPWQSNYLLGVHRADALGFDATADFTTGIGVLTAQYGHVESSRWDNRQLAGGTTSFAYDENQDSLELRFASKAESPVSWVLGAFYLQSEQNRFTRENRIGGTTVGAAPVNALVETGAVFGQVTVPITDAFRVTGGARYTKETKKQRYSANPQYTYEDDAVTWKAGVEFDLAPRSMLYGGISSGYKAGGFGEDPASLPYSAEHVTAYNIGIKNRFFDNKLQLNAEAFYYDYKDYQASYPLLIGGVFYFLTRNAGEATVKGFEIEADAALSGNDTLRVSVSHLDARFGDFRYTDLTGPRDFSNLRMPNTPLWSGDISYEHRFDLANGGNVTAGLSSHLSLSYWTTGERTLDSEQPSYTRTDLNLAYNAPDGRWSIAGYVRNLENEAVRVFGLANPTQRRLLLAAPRTFGMVGTVKF